MGDGVVRLPEPVARDGDLGRMWDESLFEAGRGTRPPCVAVTGHDRVWETITGLFRRAAREIASLDDPARVLAYNGGLPQRVMARCGDFQGRALERGVDIVQITTREGLALNPAICCVQWDKGGKLRLVEQVPYKLLLFDRRLAVLPMDGWILSNGILVVRDIAMVSALLGAHRSLWQGGLHPPRDEDAPPPHLAPVLRAMLNEPSDQAARRRLGMTPRTYSRRVAELFAILDVTNRFQAGAAAARRGWLLPSRASGGRSETGPLVEGSRGGRHSRRTRSGQTSRTTAAGASMRRSRWTTGRTRSADSSLPARGVDSAGVCSAVARITPGTVAADTTGAHGSAPANLDGRSRPSAPMQ